MVEMIDRPLSPEDENFMALGQQFALDNLKSVSGFSEEVQVFSETAGIAVGSELSTDIAGNQALVTERPETFLPQIVEYDTGPIFTERTHLRAIEMALTNRAKLEEIEAKRSADPDDLLSANKQEVSDVAREPEHSAAVIDFRKRNVSRVAMYDLFGGDIARAA